MRRLTTSETKSGDTGDTAQLVRDLGDLERAGAEDRKVIAK